MVGEQMCCGVLKNDLIVRIEPTDFTTLVADPHVRPFDFTRRPMQGMVYVDVSALRDPEVLRAWIQHGTDYVASLRRRRNAASAASRAQFQSGPGSPPTAAACQKLPGDLIH